MYDRRGRAGRLSGPLSGPLAAFSLTAGALLSMAAVATMADGTQAAADLDTLALEMVPVADNLEEPVFVTTAPGDPGRLYVVEQAGRIRVLDADGVMADTPFLDLSADVVSGGERGLLGLAFHPDYADNGRLFVNYTRGGDGATVVAELSAVDGAADRASERQLLVIDQPFANHNGGMIEFDAAGMLLIGTGDGGSGGDPLGAGQDPGVLLAKLLRIDVDGGDPYGIPTDNGFVDRDDHRPEIHALGLRNPWRFSVDPKDGHVYIGDVGQNAWEEVSLLPGGDGGLNFGWNAMEGPECFLEGCDTSAYTPPVLSYGHDEGCSIVGGYTYRGTAQPSLEGVYLFGDYCSGTIWAAEADAMLAGEARAVPVSSFDGRLVSFGADEAGELYAVDHGGRIFRIVASEAS
jgi:glucose/arabinose dehydrogenase